jgi:hypothetical protein
MPLTLTNCALGRGTQLSTRCSSLAPRCDARHPPHRSLTNTATALKPNGRGAFLLPISGLPEIGNYQAQPTRTAKERLGGKAPIAVPRANGEALQSATRPARFESAPGRMRRRRKHEGEALKRIAAKAPAARRQALPTST